MTPAERLLAAADLLDKRAGKATQGQWKLWGMSVMADQDGTSNLNTALPVANTSHEAGLRTFNATYIATMQPEVGKLLAASLREAASTIEGNSRLLAQGRPMINIASAFLLDLADLLLAGAS